MANKKIVDERVELNLPISEVNTNINTEVCFVNGKRYEIKLGKTVKVPPVVRDILLESKNNYLKSQKGIDADKPLSTY